MNREAIYQALFDISADITWSPSGAFAYRSRRVRLWGDLPAQPALCQAEHDETVAWKTSQEPITTLGASWLLYHQAGKDSDAVPASTTNPMVDAVWALFTSDTDSDGNQHLGINVGSPDGPTYVYRAWIEGRIQKFQGDLDGQTLVVVPIKILVP